MDPIVSKPRIVLPDNGAIVAKTPGGGIAGRTGASEPFTLGSASCTLGEIYDDSGTMKMRAVSPTQNVTVLNMVTAAIAGDEWIQAKKINGQWVVDVEECEGS